MTLYSSFPLSKTTNITTLYSRNCAIFNAGALVCDWLTAKGITCVLLKYRVPGLSFYPRSAPYLKSGPYPESPIALEDAQRAVGLVRFNASKWHIDPHKIGVLGFSAGGHLVAAISTHFKQHLYPAVDAADKESCRPDFAIALYPGHLSLASVAWDKNFGHKIKPTAVSEPNGYELNPDVPVTKETPPTFLLQAENDHEDNVDDSLVYYIALKNAGVPVEMHLYSQGGHAFGLRRTKFQITAWPHLVDIWLQTIGITAK